MNKQQISAIIFDMDGVLWRGNTPIGNPADIFKTLNNAGIKTAFATNNATKSIRTFIDKLASMGINAEKEQLFTSATATAQYLKNKHKDGGNVYVVGMDGLIETLESYGFSNSTKSPLAVVVALDEFINYEKMKTATLLIHNGVPFIGTNPDKTFPSPEGLIPGAGSIIASIEAATDTEPLIIGKPKATMFLQALEYLECAAENVLVVGDRLGTDIQGGQAAGCKTALVLSGVTTLEQAQNWEPKIDFISKDLTTLISELEIGHE